MWHFVYFSRNIGLHRVQISMNTRWEVRGNEAICAISLIDSESMIPYDSALAATSISSGGTAVSSLALVEEARVILCPSSLGCFVNMMIWPHQCLATSRIRLMLWDLLRAWFLRDINRINKDIFIRGRDGEYKQLLLASSLSLLCNISLLLLCLFLCSLFACRFLHLVTFHSKCQQLK